MYKHGRQKIDTNAHGQWVGPGVPIEKKNQSLSEHI